MANRLDVTITFTREEPELLQEALDSHAYWQLSDEHYRHSGFVYDPGSDDPDAAAEIRAWQALETKPLVADRKP